jgi:hypothetical protein
MMSKREYIPTEIISEDLTVYFFPVPESSLEFLKRKEEVQEMIAQMILLGRKKGRPPKEEEEHEEAA